MEGSAEDVGAPDSWERTDLDESMSRLKLSSNNINPMPIPHSEFSLPQSSQEPPELSSSSSSLVVAVPSANRYSEDVLNQVDQFLREALQNPRERLSILRMEQDVLKFIHDQMQQQLEFQKLPTSYLRLAVHRVAQHYNLQSMVMLDNNLPNGSGSRIVVCKTSQFRFPLVRLVDIPLEQPLEENDDAIRLAIKQRPQKCSQTTNIVESHPSRANYLKTVEERKEEYDKARARIFSSNGSCISGGKPEDEPNLWDGFQDSSLRSTMVETCNVERPYINLGRSLSVSSTGSSSRSGRNRPEKELNNRQRANNRVAIFRNHELDRKDPDYDRRYLQRFDPGFGFSGGQYTIQPMYSPVLNCNTEFPHLVSSYRPPISIEHQSHPLPQHMHGPWATASSPTTICYGPPESMMASFSPSHVASHSSSAIYLHTSHYPSPYLGMTYIHPREHIHQPFAQPHQQKPEARFGLARPR